MYATTNAMLKDERRRKGNSRYLGDVYGVVEREVVEVEIPLLISGSDQQEFQAEITFFCRHKGITQFELVSNGRPVTFGMLGRSRSRCVLKARGTKEQISELKDHVARHPIFETSEELVVRPTTNI